MKIVVTGGSGLVGRRVVSRLARRHTVTSFDRREPPGPAARHVRGDVLDERAVARVLEGADAVVHAAGIPGPGHGTPEEIARVNVEGTTTVASAALRAGVSRLVNISSEAVLGFVFGEGRTAPAFFPIDETHPLGPTEPYGRSKLEAEIAAARLAGEELTLVHLRPPWVWVPEEREACLRLTRRPEDWWDGLWAYIHGDDLARAVDLAVARPLPEGAHAVYVAAPDNGTIVPTAELVARFYPGVPVRGKLGQYQSLLSSERARRLLGFEAAATWRTFLPGPEEGTG